MATKTPLLLILNDERSTQQLAEVIAKTIIEKDLRSIVLSGDLGAGKTTLTQFIAAALGSTAKVSSPTFMMEKVYAAPQFKIVHMDLYRVGHTQEIEMTIKDYFEDPQTIVVAEWADEYEAMRLPLSLHVALEADALSDTSRRTQLLVPEHLREYVLALLNTFPELQA
jgi:tRNA threonylcarbamoyladenosine biosynthesis protein TsaE